jgi:hypothetical protein
MIALQNTAYQSIRGFNYQPSNAGNGIQVWERFEPALYRRELSRGKSYFPGMNTVRVWLSFDAWLADREGFLRNIAAALGIVDELGLKAIPVLFNGWFGIPIWGGLACEVIGVERDRDDFGVYRRYAAEVVEALVARRRAVLIWDLCNEPLNNAPTEANQGLWADFLRGIRRTVRERDERTPITIGSQWANPWFVERFGDIVDVFSLHPYYPYGAPSPEALGERLDESTSAINSTGKPALVTECCWGSLDDDARVGFIKVALTAFKARGLGFMPHLLHHTLVADGHRPEFGHVGVAGYMAFIEADGRLRAGHDVFNNY